MSFSFPFKSLFQSSTVGRTDGRTDGLMEGHRPSSSASSMQLSSLIFGKGRRRSNNGTMLATEIPEPTATSSGGVHFGDLHLGLKTLADHSSLSSSCVTRKLLSSAQPSLASTSSYCSSLSSSSSFSSLSSLSSLELDFGKNAVPEEEVVEDEEEEEDVEEEDEENEDEEEVEGCWGNYGPRDGVRMFPPPIPIRKVLTRRYNDDDRLVIQVGNIKHHEFFWSHRSNGRLTLKSIHMHINSPDIVNGDKEKEQYEEEGRKMNPAPVAVPIPIEKDDDENDSQRILDSRNPRRKLAASEVRQKGDLASSKPESTIVGNGCFMNGRSAASLFQIPVKS